MGTPSGVLRGLAAAALAGMALHCSLTTSLDDLSGGEPAADASARDAESPADAPATPPPPADAATDGAPREAAANDAGADAASARWCATQTAKFCEDFDDPSGVWSSQWSPFLSPGATASLDSQSGSAAPGSFMLSTDGSTKEGATLTFTLPPRATPVSKLSFAYDMRIDTYGQYAEVGYLRFASGQVDQTAHYLRVYPASTWLFTSEAYLADGGIPQNYLVASPPLAAATWVRVGVTIDLTAQSVTIRIGGTENTRTLDSSILVTGQPRVSLGFGYTPNDHTSWAAHFDDVTVDWQ